MHIVVNYTNRCSPSLLALDSYISPNESASQVTIAEGSMTIPANASRKAKPETAWVWSQYQVVSLESSWKPKGKSNLVNDRLILCT